MVFSCDEQSQTIIASIPGGQNAEQYDCVLSACTSPSGIPGTVYLTHVKNFTFSTTLLPCIPLQFA